MVTPFFSIIIPIYNKELYIKKCVDSITAQTFGDFEVIIINDGSTDNSEHILNSITDSRFQVFSTPNGGVSSARNFGIQKSCGQYLLFIDADDSIAYNYCQSLYEAINIYTPTILVFGFVKVYQNQTEKTFTPNASGIISFKTFFDTFMTEFERLEGIYGYAWNKAIKRSFIVENNILFNCSLKLAEDLDFWLDIYRLHPTIAILQYAGYYYIQEAENSSVFYKCDPWPLIKIWLKAFEILSPCNSDNEYLLQAKLWGLFRVAFLEQQEVSLQLIDNTLERINGIKTHYIFLNSYKPNDYLTKWIKYEHRLKLYVYLLARKKYHQSRSLWRKSV